LQSQISTQNSNLIGSLDEENIKSNKKIHENIIDNQGNNNEFLLKGKNKSDFIEFKDESFIQNKDISLIVKDNNNVLQLEMNNSINKDSKKIDEKNIEKDIKSAAAQNLDNELNDKLDKIQKFNNISNKELSNYILILILF